MSRCHRCQGIRRSLAYEEGFEDGFRAGLENGFAAGRDDGRNSFRQTRAIPNEEYALGFDDGFNAGAEAGYAQGFESSNFRTDRRGLPCNEWVGVQYPTARQLCSGPNCRTFTLRTRNGVLRFDGNRWSRVCRD